MDLHLIVDGLDDSKRANDVTAKNSTPPESPTTKPLRQNIDLLPNADAAACISPSSSLDIDLFNSSANVQVDPADSVSRSGMGVKPQIMEYPCSLPDRYCHPKHFNPPRIAPSHKKKPSTTKIPVGVIGGPQKMQNQSGGISPTESPSVISQCPVGRVVIGKMSYTSDFINYPSPPQITPDHSHVQINQAEYPTYHGVTANNELSTAAPAQISPYTTAVVPYYAAHTSPNYQDPVKSEVACLNTQDADLAYFDVLKNSIQNEHRQHRTKILLDYSNSSSKYWKLQLTRTVSKPVVSANSVNEYIMLFDADTNTILPDKRGSTSKNIKHGCKQCGRIFLRKCDLVRHIQMHLGIRPNVCGICGKRFIQRSALTIHLRVHTGEKPFSCSLCGRAFSDSSSLARHRHTHKRNAKQFADRMRDSQYQTSLSEPSKSS